MEKEGELLKFKGFYFQSSVVDYDILEKLEDFEIRDNDIFVISYPKSGLKPWSTTWESSDIAITLTAGPSSFIFISDFKSCFFQDLRSSVLKICTFLEKELTDDVIDSVIQQCLFENMKYNLETPANAVISTFSERRGKTEFIRRGVVGDWKNYMTVEQSERFDKIYQNKMKDFPLEFIWNINEEFQTKA
ncbi:Amine sulfotransferase [Tupaia chinensis]|uniref:Sulfotransferase n=1 Tax=Tupaia chinensis TaxID=246437 RepID=L8YB82_TUPCH|nr:Amine sulfotransferase [Tupaia chinensis]